jgi:vancomycin resistance protein VanW
MCDIISTMVDKKLILNNINEYKKPRRRAFSSKYPLFLKPIIFTRRIVRDMKNFLTLGGKLKKISFLPCVIARHSSPLYRKLGETDSLLQINKICNIKLAIEKINGIIIPPGKTFSFWYQVGKTDKKNGYVDGLVLSNGTPSVGVGGGLCQLSNFLFWIFLHTDIKIIERHHHSVDAFPDSRRTLPFGSGATIFCNYMDLKIKNISDNPLQIKIWLTDKYLKGQILSNTPSDKKFHIKEREHCFIKKNKDYFRYNEIYRETRINGQKIKTEGIIKNFVPVKYEVSEEYIKKNNYKLIKI